MALFPGRRAGLGGLFLPPAPAALQLCALPRRASARSRAWSHQAGSCLQRLRTMARPTSPPRCRAQSRGVHSARDPGIARSWGPRARRARAEPRRRGELPSPESSSETETGRWGRRGPSRGGSALGLETQREPRAWQPAGVSRSPTPTSVRLLGSASHRPPSSRRRSGSCHPVNRPLPSPGALT